MLEVRGGGGVREGRSGWEDTGLGLTWDGKWDFQESVKYSPDFWA